METTYILQNMKARKERNRENHITIKRKKFRKKKKKKFIFKIYYCIGIMNFNLNVN